MRISELLPGCKVDIRIVQCMENQSVEHAQQGIYYSTIFDVYDDNTLELMMPMVGGKLQLLRKHIRYEFVFSTANGLYKAEGTITDHVKKNQFYLLKVELTSALEKYQRRQYYRVACMIPMIFMALTEEAVEAKTVDDVKECMKNSSEMKVRGIGTILDISGGGARFVSTNSLQDVTYLLLEFQLQREGREEELDMDVIAKMIHSERMEGSDKYMHRVQFFFKDNHTKEQLIGYVFEEERRIRKKEQGI